MIAIFYLNELLMYLLPRQDASPDVFELYQRTLLQLQTDSLEAVLRSFEFELLTALGLMPELGIDCISGDTVVEDAGYRLNPTQGLLRVDSDEGQFYPGRHLLDIQAGDFRAATTLQTAKRVMRSIIDVNLQGRALQSRSFYQQMNQRKKDKAAK